MGVAIEGDGAGALTIGGRGLQGLSAPQGALDLGNSGTGMRLLAGVAAGQLFCSQLVGDASLSARPMARIVHPLRAMGARVWAAAGDRPPLRLCRGARMRGIDYAIPVASAQVKSCLLLAGLYAEGVTRVVEPGMCRDHTERMLRSFGYPVVADGPAITLAGGQALKSCPIEVPGDISSAAFFVVAATLVPGSDIVLRNVGVNPTRDGVLHILRAMGAQITLSNERLAGAEPVADIRVEHALLRGIDIPQHLVANAIDEFPVIFVAAACASGTTRLRGARELRVKESDRIAAMAAGLATLGVVATVYEDGIDIEGGAQDSDSGALNGGVIDSFGDHRIAMAFVIAGALSNEPVQIKDCENIATSFPGFVALAQGLGIEVCSQ